MMTPNKTALLLAASGLALTLAACKVDNRPLLGRDSAPADAYANGLPQPGLPGEPGYGQPAYGAQAYRASYLPPQRAYPYAERAYGLDRAFYGAPPAYGFAYAGEEPWVWEAADDSLMFVEPYGGDYRYYYYQPGVAYPYFVRDAGYGYALGPNGALLALFDAAGALLSADRYDRYYPSARQYWSRGYDLYGAYGSSPRLAIDQAAWRQSAPRLARFEQPWIVAPATQPAWRQWRAQAGPAALQRFAVQSSRSAGLAGPGHDNGLHLGWERGRHLGWDKHGAPAAIAAAPPSRLEAPRGFAREDRGRMQPAPRVNAPSADRHGREAAFRGPERRAEPAAPGFVQPDRGQGRGRHGGEGPQVALGAAPASAPQPGPQGHGRHGGGEGPRLAQAAPPPAAQGGWHGGGDHGRQMQAQAQPQAQPQAAPQPHGNGHGAGQGGGQGGGGQGKPDKGHGHGH
jgi:hypothetical protein